MKKTIPLWVLSIWMLLCLTQSGMAETSSDQAESERQQRYDYRLATALQNFRDELKKFDGIRDRVLPHWAAIQKNLASLTELDRQSQQLLAGVQPTLLSLQNAQAVCTQLKTGLEQQAADLNIMLESATQADSLLEQSRLEVHACASVETVESALETNRRGRLLAKEASARYAQVLSGEQQNQALQATLTQAQAEAGKLEAVLANLYRLAGQAADRRETNRDDEIPPLDQVTALEQRLLAQAKKIKAHFEVETAREGTGWPEAEHAMDVTQGQIQDKAKETRAFLEPHQRAARDDQIIAKQHQDSIFDNYRTLLEASSAWRGSSCSQEIPRAGEFLEAAQKAMANLGLEAAAFELDQPAAQCLAKLKGHVPANPPARKGVLTVTITGPRQGLLDQPLHLGSAVTLDGAPLLDGAAYAYRWGSADGKSVTGQKSVTLIPRIPGEKVLRLTVTDPQGRSARAAATISVPVRLQVSIAADKAEAIAGDKVTTTAAINDEAALCPCTFAWRAVGIGQTFTGKSVWFGYHKPGQYAVTLDVKDRFGQTASAAHTIAVKAGADSAPAPAVSPTDQSERESLRRERERFQAREKERMERARQEQARREEQERARLEEARRYAEAERLRREQEALRQRQESREDNDFFGDLRNRPEGAGGTFADRLINAVDQIGRANEEHRRESERIEREWQEERRRQDEQLEREQRQREQQQAQQERQYREQLERAERARREWGVYIEEKSRLCCAHDVFKSYPYKKDGEVTYALKIAEIDAIKDRGGVRILKRGFTDNAMAKEWVCKHDVAPGGRWTSNYARVEGILVGNLPCKANVARPFGGGGKQVNRGKGG
jgi:hypothetical protein